MQAATFYGPEEHYMQPWATEDETAQAAKAKPQAPSAALTKTKAFSDDIDQWKQNQAANKGAQS